MLRGRRETTLVRLVNQLDALDAKRRQVVAHIQQAVAGLGVGDTRRGRISSGAPRKGRPHGSKMSPEARAKISAAQKARWAKQRAAKKG
jgi:hypothetical protein